MKIVANARSAVCKISWRLPQSFSFRSVMLGCTHIHFRTQFRGCLFLLYESLLMQFSAAQSNNGIWQGRPRGTMPGNLWRNR